MSTTTSVETRNKSKINKLAGTNTKSTPATDSPISVSGTGDDYSIKNLIFDLSAKLENMRCEFQQQIHDLQKKIVSELQTKLYSLFEENLNSKLSQVSNLIAKLEDRVDVIERRELASDVIINGIPRLEGEDLSAVFGKLCSVIQIRTPAIKQIFRVKRNGNSNADLSIIVKFNSEYDKNVFLKSISARFKATKQVLTLRDVGLDSNNRIFIHESLTKSNYILYRNALRLKRRKQLAVVFTMNGRVCIRSTVDGDVRTVTRMEELNKLAAPITVK